MESLFVVKERWCRTIPLLWQSLVKCRPMERDLNACWCKWTSTMTLPLYNLCYTQTRFMLSNPGQRESLPCMFLALVLQVLSGHSLSYLTVMSVSRSGILQSLMMIHSLVSSCKTCTTAEGKKKSYGVVQKSSVPWQHLEQWPSAQNNYTFISL